MEQPLTLVQLVEQLHKVTQRRKELSAADKKLKEIQEEIELQIENELPDTQLSIKVNVGEGCVTVSRKNKVIYTTIVGESDKFYQWVKDNAAVEFLTRAIKQDSVSTYIQETGTMPPGLTEFNKATLGVTFTRNPPPL
jgi:hypothetical protein